MSNDSEPKKTKKYGKWTGVIISAIIAGSIPLVLSLTGNSCFSEQVTILGTNDDDVIEGTPDDDVINGQDGNDIIYGVGGNDVICGGLGDDQIFGGDGDDTILGLGGSDEIFGEEGDDDLNGSGSEGLQGDGVNLVDGGPGHDYCYGGSSIKSKEINCEET